jgi:putative two-component system response regulator
MPAPVTALPAVETFKQAVAGKRFLLVDDDPDQGYLVSNFFRKLVAVELDCLESAEQALEVLSGDIVYDLLILDVMMPDMDGWELFSLIRQMERYREVPVMFLTCVIDRQDEKRATDLQGKCLTLAKPVSRSRFEQGILRLLSK